MSEPIVAAAIGTMTDAFDVLRRAVADMPADGLDWEPGTTDHTNSIAVLVTHSLQATRSLLAVAFGLPQPPRDRDAEFAVSSDGGDRLLGLIDVIGEECLGILQAAPDTIDWAEERSLTRADGSSAVRPAAFWLVHAVEHLRGHADEAALTRHVWNARR